MIPIKQTITRDHRFTISEWRKISADAWGEAAETWHRQLLPKHFTVGAFREYRYARRTRKYVDRKLKKKGHRQPMVWSGDLMRSVLRQRDVRVLGNNSKRQGAAQVKLRGPRYLRGTHRGRGPNFRQELQAISKRDGRVLARVMDRRITREMSESVPSKSLIRR